MTSTGAQWTSGQVPAVIMRGGTSKGVFFHTEHLPPAGPARDRLLLEVMGSPDPMQIDGLGGTHSSTSKVVVVSRGTTPGIDVSYWFAQVGVDRPIVDWSANCGNLTTAVGPFAIDEGLVDAVAPHTILRLRNENTGVVIVVTVPVAGGRAAVRGEMVVPGVPGRGAPVVTDYLDPEGSVFATLFPTGSPVDLVETPDGPTEVSIVDVVHPCAFVTAEAVGVDVFAPSPAEANADPALLGRLERLRGACAVHLGVVARWQDAADGAPAIPRVVVVRTPSEGDGTHLEARGVSMGRVHHALPMSSALCLAAAVQIAGTVPHRQAAAGSAGRPATEVLVAHPKGIVHLTADVDPTGPQVRSVGVVRTARRLMAGAVFLHPDT